MIRSCLLLQVKLEEEEKVNTNTLKILISSSVLRSLSLVYWDPILWQEPCQKPHQFLIEVFQFILSTKQTTPSYSLQLTTPPNPNLWDTFRADSCIQILWLRFPPIHRIWRFPVTSEIKSHYFNLCIKVSDSNFVNSLPQGLEFAPSLP